MSHAAIRRSGQAPWRMRNRPEETSPMVAVECAAVERAASPVSSPAPRAAPQLTTIACARARELEREAAGMGFGRVRDRRRRADVGDQHGLAGLEPLVAGMRRAPHRPAAGVLIGEEGRELVGGGARPCR